MDEKNDRDTIIEQFIAWAMNLKKTSYFPFLKTDTLRAWDRTYFSGKLFSIDYDMPEKSIKSIRDLVYDTSDPKWKKFNKNNSNGAPMAILGDQNYLKFLKELLIDKVHTSKIEDANMIQIIMLNVHEKLTEIGLFFKYNSNKFFKLQKKAFLNLFDNEDQDEVKIFISGKQINEIKGWSLQQETEFYNSIDINALYQFRKAILNVVINYQIKTEYHYHTISSGADFNQFYNDGAENILSWGQCFLASPLNGHSRSFLQKGDVLFCNRLGEFQGGLREALMKRGIYAIGVALTDPFVAFPQNSGDKSFGILLAFPFRIKNLPSQDLRSHPETFDVTPFNGNRNDTLQIVKERKQWEAIIDLIYTRNPDKALPIYEFCNYRPSRRLLPTALLEYETRFLGAGHNMPLKKEWPLNRIIYGAPGTGKSLLLENESSFAGTRKIRINFYPDYTYSKFVGSYKPATYYKEIPSSIFREGRHSESSALPSVISEPVIDYSFIAGPFLEALIQAYLSQEPFLLIIEELNRANAAAVFGEIFQLLDRRNGQSVYLVKLSREAMNYIKDTIGEEKFRTCENGIYLPSNLHIWATMNSADEGVFPIDSSFRRRWSVEYMPLNPADEKEAERLNNIVIAFDGIDYSWNQFRMTLNKHLSLVCKVNEDRLLGPYFLTEEELQDQNKIKNKLLLYLRDVVRHNYKKLFQEGDTFQDISDSYGSHRLFVNSLSSKLESARYISSEALQPSSGEDLQVDEESEN